MFYRARVQRCIYVQKGTQCIPSHASNAQQNMWARPAVATIKLKRDAVNTEIGAKRNTKKFKTSKKNNGIAFHYKS